MAFFRSFDQFEWSHTLIFMSIHCLCVCGALTHMNGIAWLVTINSVTLQNVIKNQRNYFFRLQTPTTSNTLLLCRSAYWVFVLDLLCFVLFCLPEIVWNVRAANEYVTHSLFNLHMLTNIFIYGMWSTTACCWLHRNERASEISITYIGDSCYNHINRVIDYLTHLSP